MNKSKRQSYSALVELRLIVGTRVFPWAQLGPTFAILKGEIVLEPMSAKIEVIVDHRVSTVHNVFLHDGIKAKRFEFF